MPKLKCFAIFKRVSLALSSSEIFDEKFIRTSYTSTTKAFRISSLLKAFSISFFKLLGISSSFDLFPFFLFVISIGRFEFIGILICTSLILPLIGKLVLLST